MKIASSHLISIILLPLITAVSVVSSVVLFSESFDGPDLPNSLRYIADPNFGEWSIDSGRLSGVKTAQGGDVMAAISKQGFGLGRRTLIYSVDIGRPTGTVPGGSNVGMIVGHYRFVFHPGFTRIPGAFRIERGLNKSTQIIANQDMGFVPALDELHTMEITVHRQGTDVVFEISISGIGTDSTPHEFNYSFTGKRSGFSNGKIGVIIQGSNPPGTNDAFFDNLLLRDE